MQAQTVRIRADLAARQELDQQRIGEPGDVGHRPGAVDHPLDRKLAQLLGAARPPAHAELAPDRRDARQPARLEPEPATRPCCRDPGGDRRRQPMAVALPPGPQMAQEARALVGGQLLPEQLDMGPERVDHRMPAEARRRGPPDLAPDRLA